MKPLKKLTDVVTFLPRGGYLVDTPAGYIQFGSPPETIKDTMLLPGGTPLIYVLPTDFFNWIKGISVAELEFPIYYNFFIRKEKTRIVCYEEQAKRLTRVLQESLFGPETLDIHDEFVHGYDGIPDIKSEMNYFRTMTLDDVVEFRFFHDDACTIGSITIKLDENGHFLVYQETMLMAHIPGRIEYKAKYQIGKRLQEPYHPPLFGITCLGPSSGFDPYENTSGFIAWLNHQGIMIDPPVNSTEWLLDSNVNPKFIDSIILTHCHADHDAGTFQKILEEGKITIYSTETIIMSFLRKYAALTNVTTDYLMKLFYFKPVTIGKPLFINNGRFDFFYTLHSIPTIGFTLKFQDKALTYSSDHNGDPSLHKKMLETGALSQARFDEFSNFPWESDVVFHESGVPPLHTPIAYLNSLPKNIQKKTVVYHIPQKSFPENTALTLARFGIEHTIYFDVKALEFEKAGQLLSMLRHIDFADNLDISKAQEFLNIGSYRNFSKGESIIKKGTPGDTFYIICSGNASIKSEDGQYTKLMGPYDYFGEAALLKDEKRTADVKAVTDVTAYAIEKDSFLSFIEGTDYLEVLNRLVDIRDNDAWETLSESNFIRYCTSTQRTFLESLLTAVTLEGPGNLIDEGAALDTIYIIRSGHVVMKEKEAIITVLGKGDIVGSVLDLYSGEPSQYSFTYRDNLSLYTVSSDDFHKFLDKNPGLIMKLKYDF
ncbi:MAG: cAMP/cGMP-dependent 3',5'-cyclic-AMP/GMP phosphodiesterase [Spirochaetae bacterium HGW-Spirochaetae-1]|jgi:CRP-like cAMP-binding protein|nr:MAG: cAMP/cGMP-dependent 3',5'-cyclic-AMP/GMP phosphodiesterase [Spirochaetae bacterium HGW-Spirochaetae-1]